MRRNEDKQKLLADLKDYFTRIAGRNVDVLEFQDFWQRVSGDDQPVCSSCGAMIENKMREMQRWYQSEINKQHESNRQGDAGGDGLPAGDGAADQKPAPVAKRNPVRRAKK